MLALPELNGRLLILYDGHCSLCSGATRWFLRQDRNHRLRFMAADSADGAAVLAHLAALASDPAFDIAGAHPLPFDPALLSGTILVIRNLVIDDLVVSDVFIGSPVIGSPAIRNLAIGHAAKMQPDLLVRSDAVLALLAELPPPWPGIQRWLGRVPQPLRDLAYRLLARSRYFLARSRYWIGRDKESCPLPAVPPQTDRCERPLAGVVKVREQLGAVSPTTIKVLSRQVCAFSLSGRLFSLSGDTTPSSPS